MKKLLVWFVFFFCVISKLNAQPSNSSFSPQTLPVEIYMQIGFLFIYLLLGVLFLLLFIFYPQQRLHLFFSLHNICLALLVLLMFFFNSHAYTQNALYLITRLVGSNILLFIVYALHKAKRFFWWFNAFFIFIDFPLLVIFKERYVFLSEVTHCVFTLVCFVLAIMAFKNKKPIDWFIGLIALAVVFINLQSHLLFFAGIQLGSNATAGITAFVITISALIYLAIRNRSVNMFLEQQLKQVQVLSAKNLQSEKDKQQILATQNEMLEQQVTQRTSQLNQSLQELKSTQAQLIQSEKMASLGELTAGIAHEIQNPLNFVNNFSELNKELLEELKEEVDKGNLEDVKTIANDVIENEEKINHHGKRADAIVKGMLQHSRQTKGVKEATDLNALCDEYLRLSFHGLRAKDKNFNADFTTHFEENSGKIKIVPQDMGRVLLNLFNNAFYAVNERQKVEGEGFKPVVSVATKRMNDKVEIVVRDNGNGISQTIIDKVFQPFFTTKPTGQGTGLGLSLSYDIITKEHNGTIKVESKEGDGSVFTITLPVN